MPLSFLIRLRRWCFLPCLGRVYQHALASCCDIASIHNPYSLPARTPPFHALPIPSILKQHSVYSKILMLTVFLLVYLFRCYGTSAAPITDAGPPIHDVAIFIRDDSTEADAGRTVWDILWSCLATTFAVTWVSVHPNVPFLEETNRMVLKRRIFLMVLALLAPEVMIM